MSRRQCSEPRVYDALVEEAGQETVERTRRFYFEQLGESPEQVDALDATALLMRWARAKRGCQCTGYRGELWEFIFEIVDAALWLGWLFPQKSKARSSTERLRPGASRFTSYGRVTLKNLINFSERRRNNCHSLGRISGQAVHV